MVLHPSQNYLPAFLNERPKIIFLFLILATKVSTFSCTILIKIELKTPPMYYIPLSYVLYSLSHVLYSTFPYNSIIICTLFHFFMYYIPLFLKSVFLVKQEDNYGTEGVFIMYTPLIFNFSLHKSQLTCTLS